MGIQSWIGEMNKKRERPYYSRPELKRQIDIQPNQYVTYSRLLLHDLPRPSGYPCFQKSEDARLTCTAYHNPHEPLVRTASFYDQKCVSCHSQKRGAKQASLAPPSAGNPSVCPKAATNCVSCHMPKYNLPEMHSQFTVHFMRIVRPGQSYPNQEGMLGRNRLLEFQPR